MPIRHKHARKVHSSSCRVNSASDIALRKAEQYLESVFIKSLSVEFLMFIQIKVEIAGRGMSEYYNVDKTCHTPIDFARREVDRLLFAELKNMNSSFGMANFLPACPESIGSYRRSPLEIKKIEDDLAAMEAAQ